MLPKSFFPCRALPDSVAVLGRPSGSAFVSGGRLNNTQCTHVPTGASGSSAINAKLLAPVGASLQCNSGESSWPSHVNRFGILAPVVNDVLVSSNFMAASPISVPLRPGVAPSNTNAQNMAATRASIGCRPRYSVKLIPHPYLELTHIRIETSTEHVIAQRPDSVRKDKFVPKQDLSSLSVARRYFPELP